MFVVKPVVTTVTVLLVNLAFQTSIAAPSYVTRKVSDLAMLVGGTIDRRVLHYLWWHQGLWCNSLCTMAAIQIKGTARSVFPGRLCTLCGLWCMADSAPHTPRIVSHTPRLALAPPLPMVQIGYTPPTCRFSVYTTQASPSWCICTKPTRGHSITYIYSTVCQYRLSWPLPEFVSVCLWDNSTTWRTESHNLQVFSHPQMARLQSFWYM